MFGERGKLIVRAGTLTTDTGSTGVIDTVNDRAVADCGDLVNVAFFATSLAANPTASTLVFETTYDGIGWFSAGANATQASFSGVGTSYQLPQSDAHGMPLPLKQGRVTLSALTGTGSYSFAVVGYQRMGYA